jgi:hypothetical protein
MLASNVFDLFKKCEGISSLEVESKVDNCNILLPRIAREMPASGHPVRHVICSEIEGVIVESLYHKVGNKLQVVHLRTCKLRIPQAHRNALTITASNSGEQGSQVDPATLDGDCCRCTSEVVAFDGLEKEC